MLFSTLADMLTKKNILKRSSQLYRMLNLNLPGQKFKETSLVMYSVFMKLFAKACLRGAIENIYDYVQHLTVLEGS